MSSEIIQIIACNNFEGFQHLLNFIFSQTFQFNWVGLDCCGLFHYLHVIRYPNKPFIVICVCVCIYIIYLLFIIYYFQMQNQQCTLALVSSLLDIHAPYITGFKLPFGSFRPRERFTSITCLACGCIRNLHP